MATQVHILIELPLKHCDEGVCSSGELAVEKDCPNSVETIPFESSSPDAPKGLAIYVQVDKPTDPTLAALIASLEEHGFAVRTLPSPTTEVQMSESTSRKCVHLRITPKDQVKAPVRESSAELTRRSAPPTYPEIVAPTKEAKPSGMQQIPSLAEAEAAHIAQVLYLFDGNRTRTSNVLGIARSTLIRKLQHFKNMGIQFSEDFDDQGSE